MEKPCQELSFARMITDINGHQIKKERYAIFHQTSNSGGVSDPGTNIIGVSLEYLAGYVECAFINPGNIPFLYNGISPATRGGAYPRCEFKPLNEEELKKMTSKILKLEDPSKKIKTIRY